MRNRPGTLLFLTTLAAACASGEKPQQKTAPSWLEETCLATQKEVVRIMSHPEEHPHLQPAIDRMKGACRVDQNEGGDLLHVTLERIAENIARMAKAAEAPAPAPNPTPSPESVQDLCKILASPETVPKVCGVPVFTDFMKTCGRIELYEKGIFTRFPDWYIECEFEEGSERREIFIVFGEWNNPPYISSITPRKQWDVSDTRFPSVIKEDLIPTGSMRIGTYIKYPTPAHPKVESEWIEGCTYEMLQQIFDTPFCPQKIERNPTPQRRR